MMSVESLKSVINAYPEFAKELNGNIKAVRKDMPGIHDVNAAVKIINSRYPIYDELTYFFPTENLRYIESIKPENIESTFTITGCGRSILELVNQGAKRVVTIDTNPFTRHLVKLNIAAVLELSSKDYDKFLLDYYNKAFLSHDVLQNIRDGFKGDISSYNFWDCILINDKEDLLNYFFKPISSDYKSVKYGLPHLKKFYDMKSKLEQAEIEVHTGDAFDYFRKHDNEKFDYIDITNILLFVYQVKCEKNPKKFREVLASLKDIYDKNLKDNGTFAFDYFFGTDIEQIYGDKDNDLLEAGRQAYTESYNYLKSNFSLEVLRLEKLINKDYKENDTLLFTRKRSI